ncbi:MAG: peptidylprolyl isomerase [Chitinophagales bacterium]|nr:peptidylprolyl isomerase [Chitinophagales bacterium]
MFLLISGSAFSQSKSIDKIVALVNDQMVLESDINFYKLKVSDSSNQVNCNILYKIILDKLLYSKALKDSIIINDEEIDGELENRLQYFINMFGNQEKFEKYYNKTLSELKVDFREDLKQQMLADRAKGKLLSGMNPTPRDVKDYFESLHKDSIPYYNSEVQLAQIVFLPKITRDAKRAMKKKAEKIRTELINKESGFATQAILYSDDPGSASNGGELGWVEPGMMVPEFEQASFSLPVGEVSELVETQYGIHIIEVLEKKNDKVRVRHILIAAKPDADGITKAGKLADSIRNQILAKKISFQKAVELYSDDKFFKSNGGVLVNMKSKTRSPIFEIGAVDADIVNQISNMNPGDITTAQPYKTLDNKVGYRIVTLLSETPPRKASLETDYNKIKEVVHDRMRDKAMDNWVKFYTGYVFVKLSPEYTNCDNLNIFKNELK